MAEILVEKKRNAGWMIWALIALGVVLLFWWIPGATSPDSTTGERNRTADAEPVRDLAVLSGATDAAGLDGRRAELQNVRVVRATGDRMLWVGEEGGRQIIVMHDGKNGVTPGQTITVHGEVRAFPGWETAYSEWNADPSLRSSLQNQKVYVHAQRLEVVNTP